MAIYEENPIGKFNTLKKSNNVSQKRKENKAKLVEEVIEDIKNNSYEYHDFIFDLVKESLQKRTQRELKELLGNE